ncbi:hypothetical protein I4U23_023008 [Adineta vaga]|nr:hypothetical protein I4U23_023008 [Adineta vaga]
MSNLPIPEDIFDRLSFICEYDNNQSEGNDATDTASLINDYQPRLLTNFDLIWNLPENHLATPLYRDAIKVPANRMPYFTAPAIGTNFPRGDPNYIRQPRNTSLLPSLIDAQAIRVDFRQYDIVSGRNSLRKIAMNAGKYAHIENFSYKLTCRKDENINGKTEFWLQTFISGTATQKMLRFLQANVQDNRNYILYCHARNQPPNDMGLFLYEITNQNDIHRLQSISEWILKQLFVRNE